MAFNNSEKFDKLVGIIREVKPSLVDRTIGLEDSLVEQLGLDSLDITQLARKVRRVFGGNIEPQAWAANHQEHKYSVKSLLDAAVGVPDSEIKEDVSPTNPVS